MTRRKLPAALLTFFASPSLASALTRVILAVALVAQALITTIGGAGHAAMLISLVVLAGASLAARWSEIRWRGLLPISLMLFLGWAAISVFWSSYRLLSAGAIVTLYCYAALGFYVAVSRDLIQIVRAAGDVLRWVLGASLALEVFSGLIIDTPIRFWGIQGNIAEGGPIQGLLELRNSLAVVTLIALVTFTVELQTRSVDRTVSILSLVGGALILLLTGSPVAAVVSLGVAFAAAALYGIRRVPEKSRRYWQLGLISLVTVTVSVIWFFRFRIIYWLNAGSEFEYRYALWRDVFEFAGLHQLQGWGWLGRWNEDVIPYLAIDPGQTHTAALSAYVDVYLQLGLVGLTLFFAVVGLAMLRTWLLASDRKSVVNVWPALVLVVLIIASIAESVLIQDWGWLFFVIVTVHASRELSWRRAIFS